MKIVILIHQITQEKFAYDEFFWLVMIGYIFMLRMVKKMQNSGLEIVAGLTLPLNYSSITTFFKTKFKEGTPFVGTCFFWNTQYTVLCAHDWGII